MALRRAREEYERSGEAMYVIRGSHGRGFGWVSIDSATLEQARRKVARIPSAVFEATEAELAAERGE